MITPKQKLALMRQADVSPGAALLTAVGIIRDEAQGMIADKLGKIEAALPEKVVLKHIEKLKGEKGDPGNDGKSANHAAIVAEVLPKAIKGVMKGIKLPQDGRTPSDERLLELISKVMPERAQDGRTPTPEEIRELIRPMIPDMSAFEGNYLGETDVVALIEKHVPKQPDFESIKSELLEKALEAIVPSISSQISSALRRSKKSGKYLHGGSPTVLAGANVTIIEDNISGTITISSSGSGGGGGSSYQQPLSGGLSGINTWTSAPNVIFVDGIPLQKVRTDGTVNWTGTTTTILTVKPSFDIFSLAGSSIPTIISGNLGQKTFVLSSAPKILSVDGVILQQTRTDGTPNWTGTTTIILAFTADFDIFVIA